LVACLHVLRSLFVSARRVAARICGSMDPQRLARARFSHAKRMYVLAAGLYSILQVHVQVPPRD
jgi:hypothetical protein